MGKTKTRQSKHSNKPKRSNKSKLNLRTRKLRKSGGAAGDGKKLLDLLHTTSKLQTIDEQEKNDPLILNLLNSVRPEDLYKSIMTKKKELNKEERKTLSKEAYRHQQNANTVKLIPECKYHKYGMCTRKNPVHKIAHTCIHPATLIAESMVRDFFSLKN